MVSVLTAALANENRLSVKIGDVNVDCLVDTGAAVTVLGQDLFNLIKDCTTKCSKTLNSAITADGSILTVSDCGEVDVVIGSSSLRSKFHVMPQVPHQLILGMDFFKRHKVVIDFHENKIIFKDPRKVRIQENLRFPARSEILVLANVDNGLLNFTQGEFLANSTLGNLGLVVAHSVGTMSDSTVPILVLNPGDKTVSVRKNTMIGKFCPLSPDDNVIQMESASLTANSNSDNSPSIPVNINCDNLSDTELESLHPTLIPTPET